MTTREQLEAEAEELYPVLNWDAYHQEPVETYGYEECQQEAHIRAKTISAEQWGLAAGRVQDNWNLCGDDAGCHCEDATEFAWEVARDAFRAAGFLIEGDDR